MPAGPAVAPMCRTKQRMWYAQLWAQSWMVHDLCYWHPRRKRSRLAPQSRSGLRCKKPWSHPRRLTRPCSSRVSASGCVRNAHRRGAASQVSVALQRSANETFLTEQRSSSRPFTCMACRHWLGTRQKLWEMSTSHCTCWMRDGHARSPKLIAEYSATLESWAVL